MPRPPQIGRVPNPTWPFPLQTLPATGGTEVGRLGGIQRNRTTITDPNPLEPSRFITPPQSPAVTFNDSGSGTITLSGSGVESFSVVPPETNQANRAVEPTPIRLGSRFFRVSIPPTVFNDSGSGTLTLSGSGVESFSTPPREAAQASQAIELAPIRLGSRFFSVSVPSQTFNDSGSGTVVLSGSGVEAFSTPPHEPIQQVASVTAPEGRLGSRLYPQAAFAQTFNDSGSGTIVLSGSGVEQFIPPPIPVIESAPRVPYTPERSQRSQTVGGLVATGGYAPTPQPIPPLALQGKTTMGPVPQPPDLNPHDPIPFSITYYNAPPPIYNVIVQGQTNQGFKFYPVPRETASTLGNPQVIKVPASQPITYNDSGSGTIVLSGSGSEVFTTPARQPIKAVQQPVLPTRELGTRLYPQVAPFTTFNDSGSGTLVLSGSGVESFSTPPRQPVEAVQQPDLPTRFLGSRVYQQTAIFTTYTDSGSGTLVLSGSGVESFSTPPTRILQAISQPTLPTRELGSRIILRPLRINYVDSGAGTLVLSGSGFDVYVPPGAGGAVPFDPNYFLLIHA